MAIEVSGLWFGIFVAVLFLLIIGMIIGSRIYLAKKSESDISGDYARAGKAPSLASRVKYPEVNNFRMSGPVFLFGLAAALFISLLALSWTEYEKPVYIPDDALFMDEEIEIEPPRTAEPPPPPPPPPPPVIEEVPEEEILEEEEPEFMDQSIEEEAVIEDVPEPVVAPPPPPPPPEPEVEEIFKVVEQMPRFPGCENISGGDAEKKACADEKMLEYIYKNIKYPAIARENGIQGRAVIQFVVEKDGRVSDAKILRDPGGGTGGEALRVVESMNSMPQKWTPGKQRGKAVKVYFTLPVQFKLE